MACPKPAKPGMVSIGLQMVEVPSVAPQFHPQVPVHDSQNVFDRQPAICHTMDIMFSSRQAAKMLGLVPKTLSRYIAAGKVPAPKTVEIGGLRLQGWTDADIERVRKLLPKIKNGRKTRYQKKIKKQPRPTATEPHKQPQKRKKK